jgi:hypothetical protein
MILDIVGVLFYFTYYFDIEDFEKKWEILFQEGFMSSFGIFLVFWILTYNMIYFL